MDFGTGPYRPAVAAIAEGFAMMKNPRTLASYCTKTCWRRLELKEVTETAHRLGMSRASLSRVINGRAGISPDLAVHLERAGPPASGWHCRPITS